MAKKKWNPIIWLQENEWSGKASCGCQLQQMEEGGPSFTQCPLHEAAPELLEALKNALESIKAIDEDYDLRDSYIKGQAIIAKAEGR